MFLGDDSNGDNNNNNIASSVPSDLDESNVSKENIEKDDERDNFIRVFSDYKRQSAGIISEAKKKGVYLKPSVRRKLKSELARKKRNKKNRNNYRFGK